MEFCAAGKLCHLLSHFSAYISMVSCARVILLLRVRQVSTLTLLGGLTFLMERSLADRMANVMTLLLTQAALKIVLAEAVPKVDPLFR